MNNTLHEIVLSGNYDRVNEYLKYQKSVNNINNVINSYDSHCKTPLHLAVSNQHQNIANLLVKYGASTDIVDDMGQKVVWIPEQKGGSTIILGKRYI